MSQNRILITGGNGYIGARLSKELAAMGHKVTSLCFPSKPDNEQWLSLMDDVIVGDLTDNAVIQKLGDCRYDVLIHLVSLDHRQSESEAEMVLKVNVQPLWSLLHSFSKKGSLKRCLYFSTVQVYGKIEEDMIVEEAHVRPVNAYGLTHYMCEEICNYYHRKGLVECISFRLSNSYGQPVFKDANCWWLVINDLCKQAFENGQITLLSDGSPQRDFIHYNDIVEAVKVIITADKPGYQTYNLCSGQTYTILELALIIKECFKQKFHRDIKIFSKVQQGQIQAVKKNQPKTVWSNSKLLELGFKPSVQLISGIISLFDYLEQEL